MRQSWHHHLVNLHDERMHIKCLLNSLAANERQRLLFATFGAWERYSAEILRESMNKVLNATKRMHADSMRKVLAAMALGDKKAVTHITLAVWSQHTKQLHKNAVHNDRVNKMRLTKTFVAHERRMLLIALFGAWSQLVQDIRQKLSRHREVLAIFTTSKARYLMAIAFSGFVKVHKLISKRKLLVAMSKARNAFVFWNQHRVDVRHERVSANRLLNTFAANERQILLSATCRAWAHYSAEMLRESMHKVLAASKRMHEESMCKMLVAMAFAHFLKVHKAIVHEREVQTARQKQRVSMWKHLNAQSKSDAKVIARNALVSWNQCLVDLRNEDVGTKRLLNAFAANDRQMLLVATFGEWCQLAKLKLKLKEVLSIVHQREVQTSHQKQNDTIRRLLVAMSKSEAKVMTRHLFGTWNQYVTDLFDDNVRKRRFLNTFIASESLLLLTSTFGLWRQLVKNLCKKLSRHQEVLATFAKGKAKCLMAMTFAGFAKIHQSIVHTREVTVLVQTSHQRQEDSLHKLLFGRCEKDAEVAKRKALASWKQHVVDVHYGRSYANLLSTLKDSVSNLLLATSKGDNKVAMRNVFVSWNQHMVDVHTERANTKRLLHNIVTSESAMLLGATFGAWGQLVKDNHQTTRRHTEVLATIVKGECRTLMAIAFAGFAKAYEIMNHELQLRMSHHVRSKSICKLLEALSKKDANVATRHVLMSWIRHLVDLRNERVSAKRLLTTFISNDNRMLLVAIFGAWEQHSAEILRESMHKVLAATKRVHEESMHKILAALAHRDTKVLALDTFAAWSQHVEESRNDAVHAKRLLTIFASVYGRGLTSVTFGSWCRLVKDMYGSTVCERKFQAPHQRQTDKICKLVQALSKSDVSEIARKALLAWNQHLDITRMLTTVVASAGRMLLVTAFGAWAQFLKNLYKKLCRHLEVFGAFEKAKILMTLAFAGFEKLLAKDFCKTCHRHQNMFATFALVQARYLWSKRDTTVTARKVFTSWNQHLVDLRIKKRLLKALVVSESLMLLVATFGMWSQLVKDLCRTCKWPQKILAAFASIQARYLWAMSKRNAAVVTRHVFTSWNQHLIDLRNTKVSTNLSKLRGQLIMSQWMRAKHLSTLRVRLLLCSIFRSWAQLTIMSVGWRDTIIYSEPPATLSSHSLGDQSEWSLQLSSSGSSTVTQSSRSTVLNDPGEFHGVSLSQDLARPSLGLRPPGPLFLSSTLFSSLNR